MACWIRRKYGAAMEWLSPNRFYLLPQHCDEINEINELMRSIDGRLAVEEPMAVRIVRSEFVPHPGMDMDLYYYEPEQAE